MLHAAAFWLTKQPFVIKLLIFNKLGPIVQHLKISQKNGESDSVSKSILGVVDMSALMEEHVHRVSAVLIVQ